MLFLIVYIKNALITLIKINFRSNQFLFRNLYLRVFSLRYLIY